MKVYLVQINIKFMLISACTVYTLSFFAIFYQIIFIVKMLRKEFRTLKKR